MTTNLPGVLDTKDARVNTDSLKTISPWLIAISLAGLIPCLVLGQRQFIEFDGWWHLFTATQDRWLVLLAEWRWEAHPPLHYLILRFLALFGHYHLLLRLPSILSGCAASYVIGIVAAKIYRHNATALLAAAAYTFAWCMIEINCSVRAYPMALLFVLLAFNAWLDWNAAPTGMQAGRAILRFGVYSVLALLSEYYAIFFVAACGSVLLLRALTRVPFRAAFLESLRAHWKQWLFSSASIAVVFLAAVTFHMVVRVQDQHYLDAYYWNEESPLGLDGFLLANLVKEFSYFAPFNLEPGFALSLAGVILAALIYFCFTRRTSPVPLLLLGFLLAQLVVLALLGKYPFGGEFRQQSIIAPFVILTVFLALDGLAAVLKPAMARTALFATTGLVIAGSFAYGWAVYPWDSVELKTKENDLFHQMFPAPDAVYGDATSIIYYFSRTHQAKWMNLDRFIINNQRVVVYRVDDGSGHPTTVFRNKRTAFLDLQDPETYQVLAESLRRENLRSVVVYFDSIHWTPESTKILEDKFRTLAPLAGLDYGRYSMGTTYAFIEFRLR
jgi:hypothetical protein